jgi:hypothetical protein
MTAASFCKKQRGDLLDKGKSVHANKKEIKSGGK